MLKKYLERNMNLDEGRRALRDVVPISLDEPSAYDRDLELGKLLRCNYTGRLNLYWCESSLEGGA